MILTPKRKAKLFKALRCTRMPILPFTLNVEPGNICNLRCPLCPTGKGDKSLAKGFMSFELFKKVFDQLKGSLTTINLYSWGEPLLNSELVKIITYAKSARKGIRIITSTNLNISNDRLLDEFSESGIDEVILSCDGASAETYSLYRVGGDFELVMRNMRYLAEKKARIHAQTNLVWNFLVFKHNEHEVDKAQKMAAALGVDFRIGLMRTSMKDEILKPHSEAIQNDLDWIPDNPQYSAYDKAKLISKKNIRTCRKPWQEITVNWDGKVFPCCAVYGDQYQLGDTSRDSLREIWNNRMYALCRKEIISGATVATICGICRKNGFMHM